MHKARANADAEVQEALRQGSEGSRRSKQDLLMGCSCCWLFQFSLESGHRPSNAHCAMGKLP